MQDLQQLSIKRTTRKTLKALRSNAFKVFLGSGLSAKRCKKAIILLSGGLDSSTVSAQAIALSLAESKGAEAIYLGINAVDYSGYPDCRPDYLEAFQKLAALSSKVGVACHAPKLIAPLVMDSKLDIVRRAQRLGVPIELTWSCYQGGGSLWGL
jgi:7-cyano-7-deazaguanine synthase in queuosine biosynthesis